MVAPGSRSPSQHYLLYLFRESPWLFSPHQLYRASALFETIRHEVQLSTDYKLSLFDLQTSSYQALQRVLVSLGKRRHCLLGLNSKLVPQFD